jgi:hypothetical protein
VASLTPFRFSWTQDRGNGKNPVPSSPWPQPQSIALVAVGRNVARNARGRQKQTKWRSRRNFLHRCGSGNLVTQVVGCLGRVSNAQMMECDCLAAASGADASARSARLIGTLLSKMGSGNSLTWAAVYAYAAGYRLRECPRGRTLRKT